jgi:hypothetical protein|tara:strand:+ start:34 stop:510 length:477 start_codon:yes stop_codon:yes gene_type:complete
MGITTFSGPIKAGPTKDTTGTTVGTDVQNTGFVLMAQSARVDVVGATATTTVATLPPGAQVTNVSLNVFEAAGASAGAAMTIGTSTGDATFLGSSSITAITNIRSSAMGTASINVGTGGTRVFATYFPVSAATVDLLGDAVVTVEYMQPVSAGGFYTI